MVIFDGKSEKLTNIRVLNENENKNMLKQSIPDPENMNLEFVKKHRKPLLRILKNNSIELSHITKNSIYPEINGEKGKHVGERFVNGLVKLGLGKFSVNGNGAQTFKRYHPIHDENCPNKEGLLKKWKELELDEMFS